ncbi:hypothetical protein LCGC14_0374780 [marine sediment metagenome]|uniref:Uncharacterized protein n=1 Tax=marine sediment metagenome TaxID=412755 RepID=A0A0F9WCZ9_9ZZZZ
MNECNEGIHNVVRYAYRQQDISFGNCDNCNRTIALKSDYNQVGHSEIYKRKSTDKQIVLDQLLERLSRQTSFDRMTSDEKQYIQVLNSMLNNDPDLFRIYLKRYETLRK